MIDGTTHTWGSLQFRSNAVNRQDFAACHTNHHSDISSVSAVGQTVSTPMARDLVDQSSNGQMKHVAKKAALGCLNLTDEVILDSVYHALNVSGYQQLRQVQAYCHGGRVTLQGNLPTYYLKQLAQSVIHSLAGVQDIDNDVKVVSSW